MGAFTPKGRKSGKASLHLDAASLDPITGTIEQWATPLGDPDARARSDPKLELSKKRTKVEAIGKLRLNDDTDATGTCRFELTGPFSVKPWPDH
jgi:hypothetical protein